MPIFIPDKLKTPGDFPSLDANDNQVRGFGFFDDSASRSALDENFRCHGYLAFMKDTNQFKQYNYSIDVEDANWGDDSRWVLLEGQQQDTFWAQSGDAIYYSNPVWIGASSYGGDEELFVSGEANISTSVQSPVFLSAASQQFRYNNSQLPNQSWSVRNMDVNIGVIFSISDNPQGKRFLYGSLSQDFVHEYRSDGTAVNFNHAAPSASTPGFEFTGGVNSVPTDGKFSMDLTDTASVFSFESDARKIQFSPEDYKISTAVDADANVLNGVEILLPDPATGDMHFKNVAQKNFLFSTNTGSGSPTEILEMRNDRVDSYVDLRVGVIEANATDRSVIVSGYSNAVIGFNLHNSFGAPQFEASYGGQVRLINRGLSSTVATFQLGESEDREGKMRIYSNELDAIAIGHNPPYPIVQMGAVEDGANYVGGLQIQTRNAPFETSSFFFSRDGNLGIGTTTPEARIDIDAEDNAWNIKADQFGYIGWKGGAEQYLKGWSGRITVNFNNVEAIRFKSNGIGIGGQGDFDARLAIKSEGDDDTTTSILVENSSDVEVFKVLDGGHVYLVDANSNTLIGSSWSNITTGQKNVSLGEGALGAVTTGNENVAIGLQSLRDNQAGNRNVAIGQQALQETNNDSNVAIGYQSLFGDTESTSNTAVGYESSRNSAGDYMVAVGHSALKDSTGSFNVGVGYEAGKDALSNSVAVGYRAESTSNDVVIGHEAGNKDGGNENVIVGRRAGQSANATNVMIGHSAGRNTTGSDNTIVGYQSGINATGDENTIIGSNAGEVSAGDSVMIGHEAGRHTTGSANTIVGYQAYKGVNGSSTCSNTTAIGYQALLSLTTGESNTAVGHRALASASTKGGNVAIGTFAMENADETGNNGQYVVAVGFEAGENIVGQQATMIGFKAGQNATNSVTAIGYSAGKGASGGVFVGQNSGAGSTITSIAIGSNTYRNVTSAGSDIAIGSQVMYDSAADKSTTSNVIAGNGASYFASGDQYNMVMGTQSLRGTTSGLTRNRNVAIGYQSMYRAYTGANNNVAIGFATARSNQPAADGVDATTFTFQRNVFIGDESGYDISSGSRNACVGFHSAHNLTTGGNNTLIGYEAGDALTTGDSNVIIGYQAGGQLTTESDRLYIANSDTTTPLIYGDFNVGVVGIGYGEDDRDLLDPTDTSERFALGVSPDMIVGKRGFSTPDPVAGKLWVVSSNSTEGEMGFCSQYHILAAGFRSYAENSGNYARDLRMYTKPSDANSNEGTERLRITGAGDVGIGETSPDSKLHVNGGDIEISDSSNGLILTDTATSTRYRVQITSGSLVVSAV